MRYKLTAFIVVTGLVVGMGIGADSFALSDSATEPPSKLISARSSISLKADESELTPKHLSNWACIVQAATELGLGEVSRNA